MTEGHDVFRQKIISAKNLKSEKIQFSQMSEKAREVILSSKIKSFEGLAGPDSEKIFRKLVKDYWDLT